MDQQDIIAGYEARASALGIPINELCRQAELHPTTFSRWKRSERNPRPVGMTLSSMAALDAALKKLESARAQPSEAAA